MKLKFNKIIFMITCLALLVPAHIASASRVGDIVKIKNLQPNKIIGVGLVVGLNGTGDGGKYAPAMRAVKNMIIGMLDDRQVTVDELKASKNVALVALTTKIPEAGAVRGETYDVQVASMAGAKSLKGGRLFMIPMTAPGRRGQVMGFAEGAIVSEDKENLNTGVIKNGVTLTQDIVADFSVIKGKVILALHKRYANLEIANYIAGLVNEDEDVDVEAGEQVFARVLDPKQIEVTIPKNEDVASYISGILIKTVDPKFLNVGAKVIINRKTGTIIMGADVEISPAGIMQRGLTINVITPEPEATPENPKLENKQVVKVDPGNQGGVKLQALVDAMEELKVTIEDRIAILTELERAGKLHAKLEFED